MFEIRKKPFKIAGVDYDGREKYILDNLSVGMSLSFRKETNPFDINAIAIYHKNVRVGYVPKFITENSSNRGYILCKNSLIITKIHKSEGIFEKPEVWIMPSNINVADTVSGIEKNDIKHHEGFYITDNSMEKLSNAIRGKLYSNISVPTPSLYSFMYALCQNRKFESLWCIDNTYFNGVALWIGEDYYDFYIFFDSNEELKACNMNQFDYKIEEKETSLGSKDYSIFATKLSPEFKTKMDSRFDYNELRTLDSYLYNNESILKNMNLIENENLFYFSYHEMSINLQKHYYGYVIVISLRDRISSVVEIERLDEITKLFEKRLGVETYITFDSISESQLPVDCNVTFTCLCCFNSIKQASEALIRFLVFMNGIVGANLPLLSTESRLRETFLSLKDVRLYDSDDQLYEITTHKTDNDWELERWEFMEYINSLGGERDRSDYDEDGELGWWADL